MTTLVVGAGPAGCAAAMWLADLERPFVWIDASDSIGGTLRRVGNPIRNYPGLLADSGQVLVDHFRRGLDALDLSPRFGVELDSLQEDDGELLCGYAGALRRHSSVLLATGTRPRVLGVDGENRLRGAGVEISVTRNLPRYEGVEVCVIGGGDAALEGALLLAPQVPTVHLVHRSSEFRAQSRFVERVRADPSIRLHLAEVTAFEGDTALRAVELNNGARLQVGGAFVRIGVEPAVPAALAVEPNGYVSVDDEFRTSLPGVWACGDLVSSAHQSVAWAVGSAARAVRSIVDSSAVLS